MTILGDAGSKLELLAASKANELGELAEDLGEPTGELGTVRLYPAVRMPIDRFGKKPLGVSYEAAYVCAAVEAISFPSLSSSSTYSSRSLSSYLSTMLLNVPN